MKISEMIDFVQGILWYGEENLNSQSMQKKSVTASFDALSRSKLKVAMPAPSFYTVFDSKYSRNNSLTSLKMLGVDGIFELVRGAEKATKIIKKLIYYGRLKTPVISSACREVVRSIQEKYLKLNRSFVKVRISNGSCCYNI